MLTRVIEGAQKKVESRNFDIRKHLLDYDDVMNRQRQAFYSRRRQALADDDIQQEVESITEGIVVAILDAHWPEKGEPDAEALAEIAQALENEFGLPFPVDEVPFQTDGPIEKGDLGYAVKDGLLAFLEQKAGACKEMEEKYAEFSYPDFVWFERDILLRILDTQWKDHLHAMDGLREGIGLRGYAQKDPKIEYQREGYALFEEMEERIDLQAAELIFKFVLPEPRLERPAPKTLPAAAPGAPRTGRAARKASEKSGKVGRNDPCPCGSGKKYKKCCGA